MFDVNGSKIVMTRGDTVRLTVQILDSEGNPYEPASEDKLRFAIKKRYKDPEPIFVKNIPTDTMELVIEPEDTKTMEFGSYKYDIELTMSDGTVSTVIPRSDFVVQEEVL